MYEKKSHEKHFIHRTNLQTNQKKHTISNSNAHNTHIADSAPPHNTTQDGKKYSKLVARTAAAITEVVTTTTTTLST